MRRPERGMKNNIPVFNVIRNAEPVADFALGLMLDITRNITLSDKFIIRSKCDVSMSTVRKFSKDS